jgi:MurNAc alpha-1-phosphate uridylyltransferase
MPTIALLAGGLATRLGELAKDTPKSMLDVHGRPFLAWQLDLFAANGLNDVVLCIGHHGQQIEDWVAKHAPEGMRVRFSRDGERQLGTGGALQRALPLLGDTFLVAYGDSYLRCDYLGVYERFVEMHAIEPNRPLGLMTVYKNHNRYDASNVVFRDGEIRRYDKVRREPGMDYIDWGLGVLTAEALTPFRMNERFDLAEVYAKLVAEGRLAGLEMHERFYEIGSVSGIAEFSEYVRATSNGP